MRYLKKFNESNTITSIIDQFVDWSNENIKYTDEDILYYFSEFTDEWEWEYELKRSHPYGGITDLKNGFIQFTITFKGGEITDNVEGFLKLGEALKSFNIYLTQFKNLEEQVEDIQDKVSIGTLQASINLTFKRLIPLDILNKFKQELEQEEEENKRKKRSSKNYGINRHDIEEVISLINPDEVWCQLPPYRGDNIDSISLDFDFDVVEVNDDGDRIIRIIPIVSIDGEINDGMTERLSDILYNFDTEEFI